MNGARPSCVLLQGMRRFEFVAMRPAFVAGIGRTIVLLVEPLLRWIPSISPIDREPRAASEKAPWLLCIWRRLCWSPVLTSRSSLRGCTRARPTFGLAVQRRYQRLRTGQALRCTTIPGRSRIVESTDPIQKWLTCPQSEFCCRGGYELEWSRKTV
jgi:hypothetical protein